MRWFVSDTDEVGGLPLPHQSTLGRVSRGMWTKTLHRYPRLPLDVAWIAAVAILLQGVLVILVVRYGYDSHAYWLAWQGELYSRAPNTQDAYLYSPAFAQLIWPFAQLPWPVFAAAVSLGLLAVLIWLIAPLPRRWALPAAVAGLAEVTTGNVYLLMAVVVVLGWARPWSWAFVALTKITPCLGPVWFLARREWRPGAIAVGATLALGAASWALSPDLWRAWLTFLLEQAPATSAPLGSFITPPLWVRLPFAVGLVWWGARHGRRWVMPIGVLLATPVLGLGSFAVLLALPRVVQSRGALPQGRSPQAPA